MSSSLYSTSIPDATTSPIYKTAAQRVYQMPELLQIIVHFMKKQELINLALVSKEGFAIPASELHSGSRHQSLSRLFDRGCDPDRFAIYIKGVRDLKIDSVDCAHLHGPVLDLPRWLRQYPRLESIRMEGNTKGHICSIDRYQYEGRVIEAEVFRTPGHWQFDILSVDQAPLSFESDPAVSWLGFLEVWTHNLPPSDLALVLDSIIKDLELRSMLRPSLWSNLRMLDLEGLDLPLPRLEVLLGGCPSLSNLTCALSCSGGDTARYMTTLADILRRSGPNLTRLNCKTKGACVLMFARHLGFSKYLWVTGTLWWAKTKAMMENGLSLAEPKPLEGARAESVDLELRMPRRWLQQSTHEIPVPHAVAQYIWNIFPSSSFVGVCTADVRSGLTSHGNLWIEILRVTLESLIAEDLKKPELESAAVVALV